MNARAGFGRQTTIVCLLIAVGLAVVLLAIKHRVQSLEGELAALRRQTVAEQETIRVLEAEFAYLTQPERLRRLALDHLGLVPVEPGQLATFATLDEALARAAPPAKPGHAGDKGEARAPVRVAARGGAQR
jgi:cell division protein FtsL